VVLCLQAGASVVDCIVNVSDHNRVLVQMSYNHDHHNHVLNKVTKNRQTAVQLHFRCLPTVCLHVKCNNIMSVICLGKHINVDLYSK